MPMIQPQERLYGWDGWLPSTNRIEKTHLVRLRKQAVFDPTSLYIV